jgi:hypothetical protein
VVMVSRRREQEFVKQYLLAYEIDVRCLSATREGLGREGRRGREKEEIGTMVYDGEGRQGVGS